MYCSKKLKTSHKISLIFSLFNFISLVVLLVSINIIYFFVWLNDQKKESMYDMDMNYSSYSDGITQSNADAFKEYILQKDTIILPNNGGEMICSEGISRKLHGNIVDLEGNFFYVDNGKKYFIFSNTYREIGEVKVLFDITPYLNSQLIIIKISVLIIFAFLFISFLLGKVFARYSLKKLKDISNKAKELDLNSDLEKIEIIGNKDDEINILADALNKSFERIKKSNDNMKQFITDVSHEFKTPLMIINSKIDFYNKLVEKSKCKKDELEKLLVSIKSNTKKLNKLIETLFLISRITEGIQDFKKERMNVSNYLGNSLHYFHDRLEEKNLNFTRKIEEGVFMEIERSTFDIVLDNLLANAIKFSKDGSNIEIGLTKNFIYVKDFGVGIKKEDLERIREKFYKKDENKEGFGVGLFLVKRIIDLYNWTIEVESEVGKGTKFIINF